MACVIRRMPAELTSCIPISHDAEGDTGGLSTYGMIGEEDEILCLEDRGPDQGHKDPDTRLA